MERIANEKSHVKFVTIGCNGPYERRKRSDRMASPKLFICILFKRSKSFMSYTYFLILLIYSDDVSISF